MGNWVTALGIPEVIEGLLCCTTSALSAVCSKCSIGHPRFLFSLFLICATLTSFAVLTPNMRPLLDKIPYFCTAVTTNEMCDSLFGYGAVYRICFSLVVFHAVFAILMLNTTSTNDFRFKLHNGYWFLKLVLLVLITVGAFHIPKYTEFGRIWMYAGLTGGFMFIVIQIMLIIDFAHSWSISWAEKIDAGNTSFWYIALAMCTIVIYAVAITMAIFFYLYFTDLRNLTKCRGNLFLITFNLAQCLLASCISVLHQVQDESYGSGLLQSSTVTLYVMYLTWCTLSSEPDAACNPLGDVILEYDKTAGVNGQALFDCVLLFALILYACNVRTSTSRLEKLGFSLSKLTVAKKYAYIDTFDESSLKSRDKNDDDDVVEYNYSYFHFVMLLASFQVMMVVTNWHSPNEKADMKKLVKNWATVWIQLSASFLCTLFYIWAMVAPLLVKTWGPCLGLDYERVPTDDEYDYGGSRRRAEGVFSDVGEKLESGNFFRNGDKSRQITMDSGMFETNATSTHSVSRASLRPSSSKSVRSDDVHEAKFAGASENTEDTTQIMLENGPRVAEEKQTSEVLGRDVVERPQSRRSAVDEGDAVLPRSPRSYSSLEEKNENGKGLEVSPRKQTKVSSTGIKDIVGDLDEKDRKRSRPPSRSVVDDRNLTSEAGNPNQLPRTTEGVLAMSAGEVNEGLRTLSRSEIKDFTHQNDIGITRKASSEENNDVDIDRKASSEENNDVGNDRKISSDERSLCSEASLEVSQSRLSDERQNGRTTPRSDRTPSRSDRAPSRSDRTPSRSDRTPLRSDRTPSRSDRTPSRNDRTTSRSDRTPSRNDRTPSRSDRTPSRNDRTPSRSDRPIPRDIMTKSPRPGSRGDVTIELENESPTSSARRLVNHRNASSRAGGNNRVSSGKNRSISLQMQDHVGWVKRLRKSKMDLLNENNADNEKRQWKPAIDQLSAITHKSLESPQITRQKDKISTQKDKISTQKDNMSTQKDNMSTQKDNMSTQKDKISTQKDKTSTQKDKTSTQKDKISAQKDKISRTKDDSSFIRPALKVQPVSTGLQEPVVSKEILRLQAKILKFQARVVKTQQEILNMQEEEKIPSPQKNPT